jgi:hypothetical protein
MAETSIGMIGGATTGLPGGRHALRGGGGDWRTQTPLHVKVGMKSPRLRRAGRQLHLLDVENLLGGTYFTPAEVAHLRASYTTATDMSQFAQVVVGASADESAIASGLGWSGAGLRMRRGRDGADLELVALLRHEHVADRFEEVFVGSGDSIFAPVAAELATEGIFVTVVSRRRALANALRLASGRVIYLDVPTPASQLEVG